MNWISLLIVAAMITVFTCRAQVEFGLEGGLVSSAYNGKAGWQTRYTLPKWGARVGVIADGILTKHLYLQPELLFVMNGYKQQTIKGDADYQINTIEVPVNVAYKLGVPGENTLFFGLGPYAAINLFGTKKFTNVAGSDPSGAINIGSDERDDIRMFDVGLGCFAGNQFKKGLFIRFFYQAGFANLSPTGDSDNRLRNRNSGVVVGYFFKSRKGKPKRIISYDYYSHPAGF